MKNLKSKKYKKILFDKNDEYKHKKFSKKNYKKIKVKTKYSIGEFLNIFIKCLALILLFILISKSINNNIFNTNSLSNTYNITSDNWIVMTAFNSPSDSIINLEKNIYNWKIVVIGNNRTIDSNWNIFNNSIKLIYLSIEEQNKLGYNILKYFNENSYCRKNIGYLFAIQHGAKEIYEIEENLIIENLQFLYLILFKY